MSKKKFSRRSFLNTVTGASVAVSAIGGASLPKESYSGSLRIHRSDSRRLAILGGDPIRKPGRIGPPWPYVDDQVIEEVVNTTKSGAWSRISQNHHTVDDFEKEFSQLIGTKYSIGTGSGTQSLSACVYALDIGPGDEVITSPYSDMGTVASILASHALPVLVDLDPDTYQLDPDEIEKKINGNTKAIMPVHIFGLAANMEHIMAIAKKHRLYVIEDSCQAVLARYRGKGLGTIGDLGCFSFQASKQIACGEGGAVVGNDEELMDRVFAVQNRGTDRKGKSSRIGPKYRMTEFEGAVVLGQLPGVRERFEIRDANANYLTARLKDFSPLLPQKKYPGTETGAYYHYGMTYNKELWEVDRSKFLKAVQAEGVGLGPYIRNGLHKEPWVDYILGSKSYQKMYSSSRLKEYRESLHLPNCDRISDETMVSFPGSGALLASLFEMNNILDAVMKVYENREQLKSV